MAYRTPESILEDIGSTCSALGMSEGVYIWRMAEHFKNIWLFNHSILG